MLSVRRHLANSEYAVDCAVKISQNINSSSRPSQGCRNRGDTGDMYPPPPTRNQGGTSHALVLPTHSHEVNQLFWPFV